MPQPVPLRAALRVHHVAVVVRHALGQRLDGVLEGLAAERRHGGHVNRETGRVVNARL